MMKEDTGTINITKHSGIKVPFDKEKLKGSLLRSGASRSQADEVVAQVMGMLAEGMSTRKIYNKAFRILRSISRPLAARYKLKKALLELGPTGFPFELFVAELLKHKGYRTEVGKIVQGHCVSHEVDVIAEKDHHHFMVECKFHNRQGYICDVKIPLYIRSRFVDIEQQWKQKAGHAEKFHQGWVVTNTRFSDDALQYGRCMNLNLVGWDHPLNGGIKDWVNRSGLHPVTCLTTLSSKEKQILLDNKVVLCKALTQHQELLQTMGVRPPRLQKVMDECAALCDSGDSAKQK